MEGRPKRIENKEQKKRRPISMWFFRHGKADYESGHLTERGKEQAVAAAQELIGFIKDGEIIKFYTSPLERAQEMAAEMKREIKRIISEENRNIILFESSARPREKFKDAGFDDEFDKKAEVAGYQRERIIDYWMENPDEKIESPDQVRARFKEGIERFKAIADQLDSDGPRIHDIVITHSETPSPYLDEVFSGIRGLVPGGWMRVDLSDKKEDDVLKFFRRTKSGEIESAESNL